LERGHRLRLAGVSVNCAQHRASFDWIKDGRKVLGDVGLKRAFQVNAGIALESPCLYAMAKYLPGYGL